SWSRPVASTSAPSAAHRLAIAWPIPDVAPVTSTARCSSRPINAIAYGTGRSRDTGAGHGLAGRGFRGTAAPDTAAARAPVDREPAARPPRRDRVPHPPPPG